MLADKSPPIQKALSMAEIVTNETKRNQSCDFFRFPPHNYHTSVLLPKYTSSKSRILAINRAFVLSGVDNTITPWIHFDSKGLLIKSALRFGLLPTPAEQKTGLTHKGYKFISSIGLSRQLQDRLACFKLEVCTERVESSFAYIQVEGDAFCQYLYLGSFREKNLATVLFRHLNNNVKSVSKVDKSSGIEEFWGVHGEGQGQRRSTETLPPPPLCTTCGKPYPSVCYKATGGCFTCGSTQRKVKDCPQGKQKQSMLDYLLLQKLVLCYDSYQSGQYFSTIEDWVDIRFLLRNSLP
ncbi:hypothetical protein Tco_1246101 [Tanacetum coccineum]